MSCRLLRSLVVAVPLVCLTSADAHADPPKTPPPVSWGWTLAALSVMAGGTVTGVSLVVQCQPNELECARWTSLGIWGGIGIASAGALAGLLVVTAASRPSRVQVSFTVDRSQHGSSMPHATFAYAF